MVRNGLYNRASQRINGELSVSAYCSRRVLDWFLDVTLQGR